MDAISRLLTTYMLNALWEIPVIATAAWLCVRLASRLSSRYHHIFWVAALILSLAMPFASLERLGVYQPSDETSSVQITSNEGHDPQLVSHTRTGPFHWRMHSGSKRVSLAPFLQYTLVGFYLGFVVYRLLRLGSAWRHTLQLKASTRIAAGPNFLQEAVERVSRRYSLRAVAICSSCEAASPFVLGIGQPMLVLPEWVLSRGSQTDLYSILNHEFAHVKRQDYLLNLICEVLCLPIAFHPVTKLLKERIDQSRELACDEIAAEQSDSRSGYARSLLRIAESMSAGSAQKQSRHALGLFDTNNLEERIMRLLAKKSRIGKRGTRFFLVGVATILATVSVAISGYSLQISQATNQAFVGTWRADYQGKNFMVFNFVEENGKLSGSLKSMETHIHLEGQGEVYEVSGKLSDPMKLTKIRIEGRSVFFDFIEDEDPEPSHFRMDLEGPAKANLQWLELPQGLKLKPISFSKDIR